MILAQLQLKQLLESEIVPPTFTHRTLCQNFLSFSTSPHPPIYLFPTFPFFPSFQHSSSRLSCSLSLPPHPHFPSLSTTEKRRQMTPESRLTDSCCQNTSIKHTYISARRNERTHVYTHTHSHKQTHTHR